MLILIGAVLLMWNLIVFRHFRSPDRNKHTVWYKERFDYWQEMVRLAPFLPEIFPAKEVGKNIERAEFWEKALSKEISFIRMKKRVALALIIVSDVTFATFCTLRQ